MKKVKILPGILMLILCVAVIGMGIYAVTPTTHGIEGTITVTGGGHLIEMQAFLNSTSTVLSDLTPARHQRVEVDLNKATIQFNSGNAYDAQDVEPIKIILRITNKSSTDLGVFFSDTIPEEGQAPTTDTLITEQTFSATPDAGGLREVLFAELPGYKYLPAKGYTTLEIYLNLLYLSDNAYDISFDLNLAVEEYNSEEQTGTLDVYSATDVAVKLTALKEDGTILSQSTQNIEASNPQSLNFDQIALSAGEDFVVRVDVENKDPNKEIGAYFYQPPEEGEEIEIPEQATLYDILTVQEIYDEEGETIFGVVAQSYSHMNKAQASASDKTDEATFYMFIQALRDFGADEYNLSYTFVVEEYVPNVTEEEWDLDSFIAEAEEPVPIKFSSSYINEGGSETPRTEVYINNFSGAELIYVVPSTVTTIKAEEAWVMGLNIPNALTTLELSGLLETSVLTLPESIDINELPAEYDDESEQYMSYYSAIRFVALGGGYFKDPHAMDFGKIFVQEDNNNFEIENGVMYNAEKTTMVKLLHFAFGEIVLPETVEEIKDGAFILHYWSEEDPSLISLVLNNNFETIPSAFESGAPTLESITTSSSVKIIGSHAFDGCDNLIQINLTEGLEEIEEEAFAGLGITSIEIPSTVKTIGSRAFYNCTSLTEVILNEGLQEIGEYAFTELNITGIEIPSTVKTIGSHAFYKCNNLTEVILNEGLEEIGEYAFGDSLFLAFNSSQCPISTITIPSTVKTIGSHAFAACTKLTEVILNEGLEEIGEYAFGGTHITSIEIPSTVKNIGNSAFYMTLLKTVSLLDGLEVIGNYAFSLAPMASIEIPSTVKTIGNRAFDSCNLVTELILNEGLEEIGEYAFAYLSITSIEIPSTLKVIGAYAFAGCERLANVYIPNGVEQIGAGAFGVFMTDFVVRLSYLSLPPSITQIDATAFYATPSVIEFTGKFSEYNDLMSFLPNIVKIQNYTRVSKIYVPAGEGDDFRELLATYTPVLNPSIGSYLASKVEER